MNYYKSSSLKQHTVGYLTIQQVRSPVGTAHSSALGSTGQMHSVIMAAVFPGGSGVKSPSKFFQVVGRILILVLVRLTSLVLVGCW